MKKNHWIILLKVIILLAAVAIFVYAFIVVGSNDEGIPSLPGPIETPSSPTIEEVSAS